MGLVAAIAGAAISIGYYREFFMPEYNAKPHVDPRHLYLRKAL